MAVHDIAVVGASAGGVTALQRLVATLPADYVGSVFVVLHLSPSAPTLLPEILQRSAPIRVVAARDLALVERGVVYVAPPDHHLRLEPGLVRVVTGPKENSHRPSIDVLFRSAATAYDGRVAAVILSGALDDGVAGLVSVSAASGETIVQDPEEAQNASMPEAALRSAPVDHVLSVDAIGPLLGRLARGEEAAVAKPEAVGATGTNGVGPPVAFSCPECNGTLWEIREGALVRFECRVGHTYTDESMVLAHSDNLERALWTALRILEERATLHRRLASVARERGLGAIVAMHEEKASASEQDAAVLRDVVMSNVDRRGSA
jgi:two-component system chemotaxis response regulator CheB